MTAWKGPQADCPLELSDLGASHKWLMGAILR